MDIVTQLQFVRTAQADHELITRVTETAHRLFAGAQPADAGQQFSILQQVLTVKIVEHFAFEEKYVFPALLDGNPDAQWVQIITELLMEHVPMVEAIQQLNARIYQRSLTDYTGDLWTAVMDFLSDLVTHAAKEDRLYQSVLERAAGPVHELNSPARWMRDGDRT